MPRTITIIVPTCKSDPPMDIKVDTNRSGTSDLLVAQDTLRDLKAAIAEVSSVINGLSPLKHRMSHGRKDL